MARRVSDDALWAAILGAAVALEARRLRAADGAGTFSALTRRTFRTHTPPGRIVFAVGWTGLWAWYSVHILGRRG